MPAAATASEAQLLQFDADVPTVVTGQDLGEQCATHRQAAFRALKRDKADDVMSIEHVGSSFGMRLHAQLPCKCRLSLVKCLAFVLLVQPSVCAYISR